MGASNRFVRSGFRLQSLDQPFLRPRAQVRVLVRALLGPMAELGLHRLDRLAAGDGLARDRMPPHRVVAEQTEPELHQLERPDVAVDVTWKGAGLRERRTRVDS